MLIPIDELTEEQVRAWVGELYGDGGTWELVIDSTMCGMRARILDPTCGAEYVGISCAGNETRQRLGAIREAVQELVTQMGLREECIELCDAPALGRIEGKCACPEHPLWWDAKWWKWARAFQEPTVLTPGKFCPQCGAYLCHGFSIPHPMTREALEAAAKAAEEATPDEH
jgi:hypothetical protein